MMLTLQVQKKSYQTNQGLLRPVLSALTLISFTLTLSGCIQDETEEIQRGADQGPVVEEDAGLIECASIEDCPSPIGGTFCDDNEVMEILDGDIDCVEGRCVSGEPQLVERCGDEASCTLQNGEALCIPNDGERCRTDDDCNLAGASLYCDGNTAVFSAPSGICTLTEGSSEGFCDYELIERREECDTSGLVCDGGECIPTGIPQCAVDEDCLEDRPLNSYCGDDTTVMAPFSFSCVDAWSCSFEDAPFVLERCGDGTQCTPYGDEAFCLPVNTEFCAIDSDCRLTGASMFCEGDDAVYTYPSGSCGASS